MITRNSFVACVCVLSCVSFCLAGGLELIFETQDVRKTDPPLTQQMYISGQKIAMQVSSEKNREAMMIFRGDKELVWTVNQEKKEYAEITKQTMEELGQTMNSAMAQMKEQMANMPPEQRAMMEKMLQGQLGASGASAKSRAITYKKTGEKKTISGYSCVKYDAFRGEEKVRELWITPWNDLKDLKEASAAFEAMGAFFKTMLESFKDNPFYKSFDNPYSGAAELKGFPVVSVEISDGAPAHETRLKQVLKKGIPDDVFTVPAGYEKTSISPKSRNAKPKE